MKMKVETVKEILGENFSAQVVLSRLKNSVCGAPRYLCNVLVSEGLKLRGAYSLKIESYMGEDQIASQAASLICKELGLIK